MSSTMVTKSARRACVSPLGQGSSSKCSRSLTALGARSGTCQRTGERQRIVRSRAAEADTEVATPIEKSSTAFEPVMDIDAVMKILPHRYPFLLVDRVVEYEQGKQAGECGIMYPTTRTLLQKSLSLA
uniref:3-hydroxyacyl-[acyl-carrier-protein] dehydratase FabZ n=1 Tax=Chloropicon roscoffensis TaxID=1461544 RepID=A0A7S3FP59_9CHLO|mmetsp:Transcript_5906/g.17796  ORF Transcript_5906/g.17796 Transcript_5906/m.17796 type:complete len:128 (+) Transcript_5906:32-415(+)